MVPVDLGPVAGRPADPRVGDAGQQGRDDLFPEGEQGADDPGGTGGDEVPAGAAGFVGEVLAAQLAEIEGCR